MSATETKKAATAEKLDVVDSITSYYTKGIERLAELQKKGLELASQQNAELVSNWKKHTSGVPGVSGLELLDLATTAFERCVETQKSSIDLLVEQSNTLAGLAKERAATATKAVEGGVKAAQEVIENAIAAHKTTIDLSAKQTKAAIDVAKQKFSSVGIPSGAAADLLQQGVDVVVNAQKELLDSLKKQANYTN